MFVKSRKGVSPVIAVVLIIALVVAGGAVVWVITQNLLDSDIEYNIIESNNLKDYNNDTLIDAMEITIVNFGETNSLNFVSIVDDSANLWYVIPGGTTELVSRQEYQITIFTNVTSFQIERDQTVSIAAGPSETEFSFSAVEIGVSVTLGTPVTVTVSTSGSSVLNLDQAVPIVGALVYFTTSAGLPTSFPPTATDSQGQIKAYLLPNYYIALTISGRESDVFHSLLTTSISLSESSQEFTVSVQDSNGLPLEGVSVYTADNDFNDLGGVSITDASGQVTFSLGDGRYLFRANYLGQDYWSSEVEVPLPVGDTSSITIRISSGDIVGRAVFGETGVGSNKLIRLYNSNNQSMGRYDYTNSTSHFEFVGGIPSGTYRLRLDFQGRRYWSSIISTSDANLTVNFGGGDLTIELEAGGSPLPNGVLTRLYHADTNSSAGRYDYLNSTGFAEYGPVPAGSYRLRIDWLGQRFYTTSFDHDDDSLKSIDIGGGQLNVSLTAGGSPLPQGVLARLYNEAGSNTGRYDYLNGSGVAEYGSIIPGTYKIRIDWMGQRFYTVPFVHDDSAPIAIDIGGGPLNVQVSAGDTPLRQGILARLYNAGGQNTGIYDYLNGSGFAEYGAILPGEYKLRIDWMGQRYYTDTFNHTDSSTFYMNISGGVLNIQVVADGSSLPQGVLARLYNDGGSNTGIYDYLNGSGFAEYGAILPGLYKLRIDWLGQRYYTQSFNHSSSTPQVLSIEGGTLNVQVLAGGDELPSGVLIRLYNDDNSNTGKYDYLNGTSVAEFGTILPGSYKLRVDWLGKRTYSSVFIHNSSTPQTIDVGGGDLNLKIEIDGSPLPNGVLVRLYNPGNVNTGRYDYTFGSDGSIYLQGIIEGNYLLRIDWMGSQTYTSEFTHDGSNQTITLNGVASMELHIEGLGAGVQVRLYRDPTSYTGRYGYTDANGNVTFTTIPDGDYKIRLGSSNYSDVFTPAASVDVTFGGIGSNSVHNLQIHTAQLLPLEPSRFIFRRI